MNKESRKKRRMNLFQRLSFGFILIFASCSILLAGIFCVFYQYRAEKSISNSIRQTSEIDAKNISNVFSRIDLALSSMGSSTSGIYDQLMSYDGSVLSCVKSFQCARDLLSNYMNVALRFITSQYHVSFFVDPSFELYERLCPKNIYESSPDGQTWMYSDAAVQNEGWFQTVQATPNKNHWFLAGSDNHTLYMARRLEYMIVTGVKAENITLGVVVIQLNTDWIQESLNMWDLTSNTQFALIDGNDQVLYASNPELRASASSDINTFWAQIPGL